LLIIRIGCCFAWVNPASINQLAHWYKVLCQVFTEFNALYINGITYGEGKQAMKTANRLLALSVLATGALFTTSTLACSTDAWAVVAAESTAGSPTSVARVMGKCGLQVTADGVVTDNTPTAEETFIVRFYFFGKNLVAGPHDIFQATSADANGGSTVFKVTYDGANISVDASGAGGGSVSAAALPSKWNLVEVSWDSDGTGSLWVNADATIDAASGTFNSGSGSVGSATLGAVSDIGASTAMFDDYVSHRSLPIGPLLIGDSNNDQQVNGLDIAGVLKESNFFTPELQNGTPDCNLDGQVNGLDISGILKASDFFNPIPCG
jgi:hypothetical protein